MKDEYPTGKADLMTAFMLKAHVLTKPGGTWAMINLPSWMSLKSFEGLRHDLLRDQRISSMVHLGRGIFGSDFGTVAFVIDEVNPGTSRAVYRRLFDQHVDVRSVATIEALFLDTTYNHYEVSQMDFAVIPGSPIVYWLSEKMRSSFSAGKMLGDIATLRQGLATADNNRFLRQWWEVSRARTAFACTSREEAKSSGARWFPYNKGGEFRKWYGNQEHVVNWEDDGAEIADFKPRAVIRNPGTYFSPSVSWSKVSSGAPAFRAYPPGFIYDVAGTSIFTTTVPERLGLLAFANSRTASEQLAAVAPTLNYEVGQVAALPVERAVDDEVVGLASAAITHAKADWDCSETSWEFTRNPLIEVSALEQSKRVTQSTPGDS
ncbi:Eco57I restriction-modification methylase domain-containing protein [Gordonia sp. (in: high G+C Gram-positive bacteria)]|uniref:Eco57I restriction-modification methylase domain-containing protein n=1 Tax=Gordonia sp. (in: high G+C Gram-positive bacteria) TaxID=84139 RepID=UPI00391DE5FA